MKYIKITDRCYARDHVVSAREVEVDDSTMATARRMVNLVTICGGTPLKIPLEAVVRDAAGCTLHEASFAIDVVMGKISIIGTEDEWIETFGRHLEGKEKAS